MIRLKIAIADVRCFSVQDGHWGMSTQNGHRMPQLKYQMMEQHSLLRLMQIILWNLKGIIKILLGK